MLDTVKSVSSRSCWRVELDGPVLHGGGLSSFMGGRIAATCLAIVVLSGCAGPGHYRAANCPPELMAKPVYNAQTVDLSQFSGPPVNNQRIQWGDVLEVAIAGGLDAEAITRFPVRVGEDGNAFLPEIGQLPLAGLELMEAEQVISAACVQRGFYRRPQVTVTMKQQGVNQVTVVGAVDSPGIQELPRGSAYLMNALVAAGGLAENAGTQVEIRRPAEPGGGGGAAFASYEAGSADRRAGERANRPGYDAEEHVQLVHLDLASDAALRPSRYYLDDGAVVRVERRHPEPIQVVGLVKKAGQYDLPVGHELRTLGAIAVAGGLSNQLADKVYVIRKTGGEQGDSVIIEVSLRRAKRYAAENVRLAAGDIVSVEQTPATVVMDVINIIRFGVGTNLPLY
jgi:polysaccharide export outer membrane protein